MNSLFKVKVTQLHPKQFVINENELYKVKIEPLNPIYRVKVEIINYQIIDDSNTEDDESNIENDE